MNEFTANDSVVDLTPSVKPLGPLQQLGLMFQGFCLPKNPKSNHSVDTSLSSDSEGSDLLGKLEGVRRRLWSEAENVTQQFIRGESQDKSKESEEDISHENVDETRYVVVTQAGTSRAPRILGMLETTLWAMMILHFAFQMIRRFGGKTDLLEWTQRNDAAGPNFMISWA